MSRGDPAPSTTGFPTTRRASTTSWGELGPLRPALVILEATGGLEVPITAAVATAGLAVAVVTLRQVRDVAKATGQLATTDALDAQVLGALPTWRRQGMAMVVAEHQRLRAMLVALRPRVEARIVSLRAERDDRDRNLRAQPQRRPLRRDDDDLLQRVPGVGPVLAGLRPSYCGLL